MRLSPAADFLQEPRSASIDILYYRRQGGYQWGRGDSSSNWLGVGKVLQESTPGRVVACTSQAAAPDRLRRIPQESKRSSHDFGWMRCPMARSAEGPN